MKRLAIHHSVYPEGWITKPNQEHYRFLDWATNFFYWKCMIYKIPLPENIKGFD